LSKQKSELENNPKSQGLEQKVWGFHAVQALFERRPQDLVLAYLLESEVPKFGPLLKYCAKARLAYHIVKDQDLAKISGTMHHEGVCVLARSKQLMSEEDLLQALQQKPKRGQQAKDPKGTLPAKSQVVFLLDGLANPHNLGALTRSCAFLGVRHIVLSKIGADDAVSPAAKTVGYSDESSPSQVGE
jgi:TrmH RNA methyltransferase